MAKRAGRKSREDSKFPDPKVWKWCRHKECQKKAKKLPGFGSGGEKEQELMRKLAVWDAVLGEDYCWKHLSVEAKVMYKAKIEKWASQRHSFEGTNLSLANLHKVNLQETNLKKTSFYGANLQGANLEEGNLQSADLNQAKLQNANLAGARLQNALLYLANLQNANLGEAELQKAFLREAKLQKTLLGRTNFQNADLSDAKLQEAYLGGTNFQNADLEGVELNGAFLYAVELDGAKRLTWKQLRKRENGKWVGKARVGEEKKKNWQGACDAYRLLKNYFHQQGQYQDEAKAYYREKLMVKHQAHMELIGESFRVRFFSAKKSRKRFYVWLIKGFKRAFQNIGTFFRHNENKSIRRRWFGLWFMWALAGFGERWSRTVSWAAGTFAFFGLLHWMGTNTGAWVLKANGGGVVKNLLDCLYFSLVTFVTLGFGDIWPASWFPKIIVGIEVVLGYVFLGLLVTLIARKMGR